MFTNGLGLNHKILIKVAMTNLETKAEDKETTAICQYFLKFLAKIKSKNRIKKYSKYLAKNIARSSKQAHFPANPFMKLKIYKSIYLFNLIKFSNKQATVIGPIPPGTGATKLALS